MNRNDIEMGHKPVTHCQKKLEVIVDEYVPPALISLDQTDVETGLQSQQPETQSGIWS